MNELLGVFSSCLQIFCLIPYVLGIVQGQIKPHVFTWLLFSLMAGIIFVAQITSGGGAGSWLMGVGSIGCIVVTIFAFKKGEKTVTKLDWTLFVSALITIIIWRLTETPLWSVIILCLVNFMAFCPTIIKSWRKPWQEDIQVFALGGLSAFLAIAALDSKTLITLLYPAWIGCANIVFVMILVLRRRHIKK